MFALLSTAWVVPGVVGPSIAAIVGEFTTWRLVFLGLLPLLAVAGGPRVTALRRIPAAAPPGALRPPPRRSAACPTRCWRRPVPASSSPRLTTRAPSS